MSEYTKQAEKFLKDTKTKMKVKFIKHDVYFIGDKDTRDIFKITFKRNKKQFSLTFGQSLNDSTKGGDKHPTSYDVLACIEKYDPSTFEDFIMVYGYNDHSLNEYPKVKKIYNAVIKQWKQVKGFWNNKELDQLREIN